MDCFGTYFTHVQTCDNVRVQSATQWTASVHTLHMSKPVITFVFKVLRNVETCDTVHGYILGLCSFLRFLTSLNRFAYFGSNFETTCAVGCDGIHIFHMV